MPRTHLKYVVHDTTDGIDRWYFRKKGQPKVRLKGYPGTDEFNASYYEALNGLAPAKPGPSISTSQTFRWLCEQYLASGDVKQLGTRTRHVRRLVLQGCWKEKQRKDGGDPIGDMPLAVFGPKVVGVLMERKAGMPEAANGRLKAVRAVFSWAVKPQIGLVTQNPAREIGKFKPKGEGFHSWSDDEVEQYEKRHPIGTKARLALALLLHLAQRRSDVVLLGKQHVKNGWLRFTQVKNRSNKPVTLELPITPELQGIIDATPCGDLTFLVTEFGQPFTSNGFGNKMREWCDQAGLPQCTAHGLRKAGARRLAERGKTGHEIKAVTGHRSLKEVDRYTEAARQRQLAGSALLDDSGTKVSSRTKG